LVKTVKTSFKLAKSVKMASFCSKTVKMIFKLKKEAKIGCFCPKTVKMIFKLKKEAKMTSKVKKKGSGFVSNRQILFIKG